MTSSCEYNILGWQKKKDKRALMMSDLKMILFPGKETRPDHVSTSINVKTSLYRRLSCRERIAALNGLTRRLS